jgi:hypothetical protein
VTIINRPYLFVFDRLQLVIAGEMDGQDATNKSSLNRSPSKKHRFEMDATGDQASKRRAAALDEEISNL